MARSSKHLVPVVLTCSLYLRLKTSPDPKEVHWPFRLTIYGVGLLDDAVCGAPRRHRLRRVIGGFSCADGRRRRRHLHCGAGDGDCRLCLCLYPSLYPYRDPDYLPCPYLYLFRRRDADAYVFLRGLYHRLDLGDGGVCACDGDAARRLVLIFRAQLCQRRAAARIPLGHP